MSNETKNCPFCGSDQTVTRGDDKIVAVCCDNCQATGPNEYSSAASWNDRAFPGDPAEAIEQIILNLIAEYTPTVGESWYFPFSFIGRHTGCDREVIRGFMQSMRNRGLVEYGVGFRDDGFVAGSGYSITDKGRLLTNRS